MDLKALCFFFLQLTRNFFLNVCKLPEGEKIGWDVSPCFVCRAIFLPTMLQIHNLTKTWEAFAVLIQSNISHIQRCPQNSFCFVLFCYISFFFVSLCSDESKTSKKSNKNNSNAFREKRRRNGCHGTRRIVLTTIWINNILIF